MTPRKPTRGLLASSISLGLLAACGGGQDAAPGATDRAPVVD